MCSSVSQYIIIELINFDIIFVLGVWSHRDDTVEPLDPPTECVPGERVFVEGYDMEGGCGLCGCGLYCEYRSLFYSS